MARLPPDPPHTPPTSPHHRSRLGGTCLRACSMRLQATSRCMHTGLGCGLACKQVAACRCSCGSGTAKHGSVVAESSMQDTSLRAWQWSALLITCMQHAQRPMVQQILLLPTNSVCLDPIAVHVHSHSHASARHLRSAQSQTCQPPAAVQRVSRKSPACYRCGLIFSQGAR